MSFFLKLIIILELFSINYGFSEEEFQIPRIYVIGDSHSQEFSGIPGCIIHWYGPRTMDHIGREGLQLCNFQKMGVKNNDVVVFCFGEIDVRCLIGKERDLLQLSQDEVIENLLEKYINAICEIRNQYDNLIMITYTVTPPVEAIE